MTTVIGERKDWMGTPERLCVGNVVNDDKEIEIWWEYLSCSEWCPHERDDGLRQHVYIPRTMLRDLIQALQAEVPLTMDKVKKLK